jgi:hypothetical protein
VYAMSISLHTSSSRYSTLAQSARGATAVDISTGVFRIATFFFFVSSKSQ